MNSDFKELLSHFNACQVSYLIIGGYAFIQHVEPRYTKDLAIWIDASTANAKRTFQALTEFGAPLSGLTAKDFSEEGFFYTMGRPPIRIDILMSVKGLTFRDAWNNRELIKLDEISVFYISKEDLLKAKLLAGRPQDLIDAQKLQEVLSYTAKDAKRVGARKRISKRRDSST